MCANFLLWTANLTNIREEDYEDRANPPLPETLVRIRLDGTRTMSLLATRVLKKASMRHGSNA